MRCKKIVSVLVLLVVGFVTCAEQLVKYYYDPNGKAYNVYTLSWSEFERLKSQDVVVPMCGKPIVYRPVIRRENVKVRASSEVELALRRSNWVVVRENKASTPILTMLYEKKEDGSITLWGYNLEEVK